VSDWWLTKDGDVNALAMYERHYSAYQYKDGRRRSQFVGPGETIVLRTDEYDALFVWRKFIDDCVFWHTIHKRQYKQEGVNCAVFRNEGSIQSSDLIRQADAIADFAWPSERHYTYVNASKLRSTNAGFCFIKAGWRKCGVTKSGLSILERITQGETR